MPATGWKPVLGFSSVRPGRRDDESPARPRNTVPACGHGPRILLRVGFIEVVRTDVLVIGGGPAGLAAGIAPRQKGFAVTVVDAARPPIDKACGEGLMPDGVDALKK